MNKALCGSLARGRTRILVTHHEEQVGPKISYRLLIRDHTAIAELVSRNPPSPNVKNTETSTTRDGFNYLQHRIRSGRLSETETAVPLAQAAKSDAADETFRVAPYIMYFKASGGTVIWLLALSSFALCEWNRIAVFSWLEEWVSESEALSGATWSPSFLWPSLYAHECLDNADRIDERGLDVQNLQVSFKKVVYTDDGACFWRTTSVA